MLNFKTVVVGAVFGVFSAYYVGTVAQNFTINRFLGRSLSLDIFKTSYNVGPTRDARKYLKANTKLEPHMQCIHVTPIEPEYQTTSTLDDGTKLCCSLRNASVYVPYRETSTKVDYLCGKFPYQQIVRVNN